MNNSEQVNQIFLYKSEFYSRQQAWKGARNCSVIVQTWKYAVSGRSSSCNPRDLAGLTQWAVAINVMPGLHWQVCKLAGMSQRNQADRFEWPFLNSLANLRGSLIILGKSDYGSQLSFRPWNIKSCVFSFWILRSLSFKAFWYVQRRRSGKSFREMR